MAKKFTGIVDDKGMESFVEKEKATFPYIARAMLNKHRNAIVYEVEVSGTEQLRIAELIKKGDWQGAKKMIQKIGSYVEIG